MPPGKPSNEYGKKLVKRWRGWESRDWVLVNSWRSYYEIIILFKYNDKEESEKVGLKLNIQKTKIMASGPITSWQIDGETVETVVDFIFLDSKITADGDCSHEN